MSDGLSQFKKYLNNMNSKINFLEFKLSILTGEVDEFQDATDPSASSMTKIAPTLTKNVSSLNSQKTMPNNQYEHIVNQISKPRTLRTVKQKDSEDRKR
jgi:hypothetical protein